MNKFRNKNGKVTDVSDSKLWTRLQDGQGADLYEGDIVKVDNNLFRVTWIENGFKLQYLSENYRDFIEIPQYIYFEIVGAPDEKP